MVMKVQRGLEKYLFDGSMAIPESTVDVFIVIVISRSMQMQQIATKHCCSQDDASESLQTICAIRLKALIEGPCWHWLASFERVFARWKVCCDLFTISIVMEKGYARTHISLVYGHWPTSANTSVAINAERHPESSSSLFALSPVLWWRQTLLDI